MKSANETKWDAYLEQHAYLKETAGWRKSFEKVLLETVSPISLPPQDTWQSLVKDGLPLLQHEELQQKITAAAAAKLQDVLQSLLKGSDIVLPEAMENSLTALAAWAGQTELPSRQQLFLLLLKQEDKAFGEFVKVQQLEETSLRLLGWALLDALVPAEAKDAAVWETIGWKRNYCPVCGRQPVLAVLRKEQEGRARFLVCDGCHTVWPYARVGCVYCGNEDLKKMHVLEPEGEEVMRLDVCDKCHAYLKTYQGKDENGEEEIYRHDWATLHLDILGSERGLVKKGSVLLASAEGEEE